MLCSPNKGKNSLISKGMSKSYLKVTIEKNWHTQNFNSWSLKCLSTTHGDITEFSNFLLQLKNQMSLSKRMCGISITLILKENMTL